MPTLISALLLAAVLGLLIPTVQIRLQRLLHSHPRRVWAVPFLLTSVFAFAAWVSHAANPILILYVLLYTAAPVFCIYLAGTSRHVKPGALDFLAIVLLWFPLEFAAGAVYVPRSAQGFLHSVAYGIAILLGLVLFLCFRSMDGMKYNPPRTWRDLWLPLAGFTLVAPVLILIGIPIGFIPPFHPPTVPGGRMAAAAGLIFAGTALPEEILFRSLIQNVLMQRFGSTNRTLLAAAFIFGCAHLDNGPQAVPNWRYMILATVAGLAYGKVFERASTVLSSALLHTLVDWTKHFFF